MFCFFLFVFSQKPKLLNNFFLIFIFEFQSIKFCAEFQSETFRDGPIFESKLDDAKPSSTESYALAFIDRTSDNNSKEKCRGARREEKTKFD